METIEVNFGGGTDMIAAETMFALSNACLVSTRLTNTLPELV